VLTPARELGDRLTQWQRSGLPERVLHEGARCLLNAAAAGMAGAATQSAGRVVAALLAAHGEGGTLAVGGGRGLTGESAALLTAFAVTQDDFDDAHAETIVHPGAAALAGMLAAAPLASLTGREFVTAFTLAVEAQLSVAVSLSPSHYELGWHSTATCAAFGSATAVGLSLGFDGPRLAEALELAALRVVGTRHAHGTVLKGYQVGRAAADGVQAALAVADGSAGVIPPLLGTHPGVAGFLTAEPDPRPRLADGRHDPWALQALTYKPYPAGIVCASGLEAALELAAAVDARSFRAIRLHVHPLVAELAGELDPPDEMRARVSLPHGVAAALLRGSAGLDEFSQTAVDDAQVRGLRARVTLAPDESMPRTSTVLEVDLGDQTLTRRVDRPIGGPDRPLSDGQLEAKAIGLAERARPGAGVELVDAVWALPDEPSPARFLAAACPVVSA
jgi:2-methylcitrate dehydratase PrpD